MTNRLLLPCLVAAVAVMAICGAFLLQPIPQDPAYQAFADDARLLSVPNFWNVMTNLPFLLAGLAGLARMQRVSDPTLGLHYRVFCIGVALVALGSAYYHFDPSTPTLVWDPLPMTVAFMALFAAVFSDRVSQSLGRALLWPRHIGVYAFRRACLLRFASYPQTPLESAEKLEQLRLLEHGERIRDVITTYDSTGVDTASDPERVRAQAGTHHG